jgi:peptide/nickel transport system substrate-binding protein
MKQPSTRSAPALQRTRQYWRTSHHRRAWLGLIVFACTFAAAWVGGGGGGGGGGWLLLAQGSKPSQAQPPQEEEITTPLPVKPPLREDDETAKPQPGPVLAAVDLLAESRRTKHPTLSKFYRDLATPYDELKLRHVPVQKIMPVARAWSDAKKTPNEKLPLVLLEAYAKNPDTVPLELVIANIDWITHYEEIVSRECEALLKRDPAGLSRAEQLTACEKAIAAALLFHEAARERNTRTGPGWDAIRAELVSRLSQVQIEQAKWLAKLPNVAEADQQFRALLARMHGPARNNTQMLAALLQVKVALLNEQLNPPNDERFAEVRVAVEELEREFASVSPAERQGLTALIQRLNARGRSLVAESRAREKTDPARARALLELAERISPDLPEVKDALLRQRNAYPILGISVPELPRVYWPPDARTDADRLACDLLFESLVQRVPDKSSGISYRPALAERLPQVLSLGREFTLRPGAVWAVGENGEPVTTADVRNSLTTWQQTAWGWAQGLDLVFAGQETDPSRVPLRLSQGHFNPLGLMSFKILTPERLRKAEEPVGSGPYRLAGVKDGSVVFVANHLFARRPGYRDLPSIREIRFSARPADPARLIRENKLHIVYLPTTEEFLQLKKADNRLDTVAEFVSIPTRRIHLLAINHRIGRSCATSTELRQLLAFAIDREAILNDHLRHGESLHRALTGPFPPGTWAVPDDKTPLHRHETAAAKVLAVKQQFGTVALKLKHPATAEARAVCAAIKAQIESVAGEVVRIDPVELPAAELAKSVEVVHDYDLAYVTYDYPDELYWLGGLLNPAATAARGANFLGYAPQKSRLLELTQEVRNHTDFTQVRRTTHRIHAAFIDEMPFVPLWQLDMHLVLHRNLDVLVPDVRSLDPLNLFHRVEEWKLNLR